MTYTYETLIKMRKLVKQEIAEEVAERYGLDINVNLVSDAYVEERLRTYMMAGVTLADLEPDTTAKA
jgi:hypothetical protein